MTARSDRLYFRLQRAAHRLQKRADRVSLAAAGITAAQAAVLELVRLDQGVSQREIARQLGINESAMTTMAARLEKAGLIERRRAAGDARSYELALTQRGAAATEAARGAFAQVNALIDQALDDRRAAEMARALDAIAAGLAE